MNLARNEWAEWAKPPEWLSDCAEQFAKANQLVGSGRTSNQCVMDEQAGPLSKQVSPLSKQAWRKLSRRFWPMVLSFNPRINLKLLFFLKKKSRLGVGTFQIRLSFFPSISSSQIRVQIAWVISWNSLFFGLDYLRQRDCLVFSPDRLLACLPNHGNTLHCS